MVLLDAALVLGGVALLAAGGEALIRGALAVARRLKISPLLSGLVIVGFGTSMPELTVSLDAARVGNADIAIGNVVGSNIGNVLLILGICAVITPLKVSPIALRRDAVASIAACAAFVVVAVGGIGRLEGLALLALLTAYVALTYWDDRKHPGPASVVHEEEADLQPLPRSRLGASAALVLGLVMLIAGAQALIRGAQGLATGLGISEALIGLTVVAVGTSLPELTVSVMAAVRKQGDVAVGNILGSNIFNILGILGISALTRPLEVAGRVAGFDQWVMLGTAVLLFVLLASRKLHRLEGGLLLVGYGAYMAASVHL